MRTKTAGWLKSPGYYSYKHKISRRNFRNKIAILAVPVISFGLVVAGPNLGRPSLSAQQPATVLAQAVEALPEATPPPVHSLDNSADIQQVLESWASSHPEHKWSVVVQGLDSDTRKASINPDTKYTAASIYKLMLSYSLFSKYSPETLANTSVNIGEGGRTDLKSCFELMISVSDNPCGVAVGNLLGWTRVTGDFKRLGLLNTDFRGYSGPVTTAGDTALFLAKMHAGELFDTSTQQYILNLMQQQKLRSGIPAGCPSCRVSDKTGDLGFVRHDAGIVSYSTGSYILSIFTDGASYNQIAELTSKIQALMSPTP